MKLVKTASGKKLKISKKEWEDIGKTTGWMKKAQGRTHVFETEIWQDPRNPHIYTVNDGETLGEIAVPIQILFNAYPPEAQTQNYPGADAEVEILDVVDSNHLSINLKPDQYKELKDRYEMGMLSIAEESMINPNH